MFLQNHLNHMLGPGGQGRLFWSAGSGVFQEGCLKWRRDILIAKVMLKLKAKSCMLRVTRWVDSKTTVDKNLIGRHNHLLNLLRLHSWNVKAFGDVVHSSSCLSYMFTHDPSISWDFASGSDRTPFASEGNLAHAQYAEVEHTLRFILSPWASAQGASLYSRGTKKPPGNLESH